jgi:hypothetical protein
MAGEPKPLRCAIFTRKSTERGLALEFARCPTRRLRGLYEFVVNKGEAVTVRTIFRYLDLQSCNKLVVDPARCHG